jgi:hypothetical protein
MYSSTTERKENFHDLVLFMGQLMQAGAILGIVFNFVFMKVELVSHCLDGPISESQSGFHLKLKVQRRPVLYSTQFLDFL